MKSQDNSCGKIVASMLLIIESIRARTTDPEVLVALDVLSAQVHALNLLYGD